MPNVNGIEVEIRNGYQTLPLASSPKLTTEDLNLTPEQLYEKVASILGKDPEPIPPPQEWESTVPEEGLAHLTEREARVCKQADIAARMAHAFYENDPSDSMSFGRNPKIRKEWLDRWKYPDECYIENPNDPFDLSSFEKLIAEPSQAGVLEINEGWHKFPTQPEGEWRHLEASISNYAKAEQTGTYFNRAPITPFEMLQVQLLVKRRLALGIAVTRETRKRFHKLEDEYLSQRRHAILHELSQLEKAIDSLRELS